MLALDSERGNFRHLGLIYSLYLTKFDLFWGPVVEEESNPHRKKMGSGGSGLHAPSEARNRKPGAPSILLGGSWVVISKAYRGPSKGSIGIL